MTDLKLKYNELKKNNLSDEIKSSQTNAIITSEVSNSANNICFVETNGRKTFLNYSYIVRGVFEPNESQITLYFTSCTVLLRGMNLEYIFNALFSNDVKQIEVIDKRYKSMETREESLVTEIEIKISD